MKPDQLRQFLSAYLAVRSAMGYKDAGLKILLVKFVEYVISNNIYTPIHAKAVVDWAFSASETCGLSGRSHRLSAARGFLTYLQASIAGTEIPDKHLLAAAKRTPPYICSKQDILRLLNAARRVRPRMGLRPHVYETLIGLMASTGIRVSEAIDLLITDVVLGYKQPRIYIRETKFHKSRVVPLHATTAKQLRYYKKLRDKLHYAGLSDAFFISEEGGKINYGTLSKWFKRTSHHLGMIPKPNGRPPSLLSLRHTFAVERLTQWCRQGLSVHELVPNLSVYLGHVNLEDSYWYLSATPELLLTASELFQNMGD